MSASKIEKMLWTVAVLLLFLCIWNQGGNIRMIM